MTTVITYLFLFLAGSVFGWVLELFFRKFFSSQNPEHKWINPGFFTGPYVPLYGMGLCLLYILANIQLDVGSPVLNVVLRFFEMAAAMTALEFAVGLFTLKVTKVRLWDYSNSWGNVMGLICPKFFLAWGVLGTAYVYFLHPHISVAAEWLTDHPFTSLFIGFFYGVFAVDVVYSLKILSKIKAFAKEHNITVIYEELKTSIRRSSEERKEKIHYFLAFISELPITEHLKKYAAQTKSATIRIKEKLTHKKEK